MHQYQTPEVLKQISDLATQINQRTQNCASEIINECMTTNGKHLEHWGKIRNPEELLALQTRLLNENRTRAVDASKKVLNTLIQNIDDFNQLSSKWVEGYAALFNPLKLWSRPTAEQHPVGTTTSGKRA